MSNTSSATYSTGECASLACLLEACAPKVGNVHRGADFEDVTFVDFAASALAIGPAMEKAPQAGVGRTALAAVEATRRMAATNTNLGIVLLLAPLAAVPRRVILQAGIQHVLGTLTPADAADVYAAIRLAAPGGLGTAAEMDVAGAPPDDLLAAMRSAAGRDLVARQYADGFSLVLGCVLPWLSEARARGWTLTDAIVHAHVRLLAEVGDTLIARKCGEAVARQASDRAGQVLAAGAPGEERYLDALAGLDFWLRSDGHRRNPGATADLITAGLFAGLRDGHISAPFL